MRCKNRTFSVSIHASTREATEALRKAGKDEDEFQSTPPRGRRPGRPKTNSKPPCFNPRLHAGGDTQLLPSGRRGDVSIHASTREATLLPVLIPAGVELFQSTPPRGRRLNTYLTLISHTCFNPRLHAGGDLNGREYRWDVALFQSTPPRGRRRNK